MKEININSIVCLKLHVHSKYKRVTLNSDIFNTIILSVGIIQMYNGIYIEHPVFRVLFCNPIAAFFLSAVNLIVFPFNMEVKYSTVVTGTNASCLIFHCCCWFVVSLLRYLYIIHKEWLFSRYPDPKYLNRLTIGSVFLTYITCWLILVGVVSSCGWPRIKLFEMPMPQKAAAGGTLLAIYVLLLCLSCFFYLLILKKKGRLKSNKVGNAISEEEVTNSEFGMAVNQFGDIWMGDSQTNDEQRQHSTIGEVYIFKKNSESSV